MQSQMEPLVDQELLVANVQLSRHLNTASKASFFLGMSVVFVIGAAAIGVFLQFIGSHAAHGTAITGGLLAIAWFVYGSWLYVGARKAFNKLRASCLKLQRAGFALYTRDEFLRHVLVAKPSTEVVSVKRLDFANITPRQLRAAMM
jgi:cytochrome c biogenesis protein CcdA